MDPELGLLPPRESPPPTRHDPFPYLGLVTTAALRRYFVVAIGMHIRAGDFGRNLFVNAAGMLVLCVATLVWCFLA